MEDLDIIDTPGVIEGENARRDYDFAEVSKWFAQHSDMIVLMFDIHKVEISNEFKTIIQAVKGQPRKLRFVLNKVDSVTSQELLRVHGSLLWYLGKVFDTPEIPRVYVGSFWDKPYKKQKLDFTSLFDKERDELMQDIRSVPLQSPIQKIDELMRRVRLAKAHAYILSELRSSMPALFFKDRKKKELINNLDYIFKSVQVKYNVNEADLPDIMEYRRRLLYWDFNKFPLLDKKLIAAAEKAEASEFTQLMNLLPPEVFAEKTPFDQEASLEKRWKALDISPKERAKYLKAFELFQPRNGLVPATEIREFWSQSKLPTETLSRIWTLCSHNSKNSLNKIEFVSGMGLIKMASCGKALPPTLV